MTTNNAINNSLPSPFTLGGSAMNSTAVELNLMHGLTKTPITEINTVVFTSSGTYTPTIGTQYAFVRVLSAGGGGGGSTTSGASQLSFGSGGGAGGEWAYLIPIASLTPSQSVVIGTGGTSTASANGTQGGTTSFGSFCSITGGSGGSVGLSTASPQYRSGGTGGAVTAAASLYQFTGMNGFYSVIGNGSQGISGAGAGTSLGSGGNPVGAVAGVSGSGYGSGGSGGGSFHGSTAQAGGSGADGVIIIIEYISA